ncbi:MAG: tetratricopeptide repeat protein, partial [Chloroflexota bacterium]
MDPLSTELEGARNAILACNYDEAAALCRGILGRYPKHIEATTLLAEAHRERGRAAEAQDLLYRVLSADPESILARWALGLLMLDQNRPDEGVASLVVAHELAPANQEILNDLLPLVQGGGRGVKPSRALLGRFYAGMGLYERAADEFRAVLKAEP